MANGKPLMERVEEHLAALVPPRPLQLAAMEERARAEKFPIIGPACGHFCYQIARMIGARQVCELGSGFGYSTAWFARAVRENGGGTVQHIVWEEELSRQARAQLDALGYGDTVAYHVGEAVEVVRGLTGPFDLVFNDIDKEGYPGALPVIAERLRPGGVLIIDNALWGGRIFDSEDDTPATQGVREVTRLLAEDPGWILSTVPIRDGMLVAFRAGGSGGAGAGADG